MRTPIRVFLAPLAVLLLAGCSGAPASSTAAPASTSPVPASSSAVPSSSTASPSSSASASAATSYTLSDVEQHDSQSDCWAAIDGGVYDLTSWISRHPGGSDKIIPLCGTDATSAFTSQHNGQEKPTAMLASFRIGDLTD